MVPDCSIGWDLSTQQLKGVVIQSDLKLIHETVVEFDKDFGLKYGLHKGVLTNPAEGEIYAPVALWLEALELCLDRLQQSGLDFSRVASISGAGMQHGPVFWSNEAEHLLATLKPEIPLVQQLDAAFSHPYSPNWQDASTQTQCTAFDAHLGGPQQLADVTGSSAHHRFSGPQILRFRQKYPDKYRRTSRISLVSSFLASVLLGKVARIDMSDACGMNLYSIPDGAWHEELLSLTAGEDGVADLRKKLGDVLQDGGGSMGKISPYFVHKYGFPSTCDIAPFTGDNPATMLALPLKASDAIVSLGTSTTFLMATPHYKPDPAYHFMKHPTTPGLYMFMLCYKNGSLAREQIRDALNAHLAASSSPAPSSQALPSGTAASTPSTWDAFNDAALTTPPYAQVTPASPLALSLFFPHHEIVPNVPAGHYHFSCPPTLTPSSLPSPSFINVADLHLTSTPPPVQHQSRLILESQFLSLRLRSTPLCTSQSTATSPSASTSSSTPTSTSLNTLPPQPRKTYIVGGASTNPAITTLAGMILGSTRGVHRLETGGNACALGAAYRALWAVRRRRRVSRDPDQDLADAEEGYFNGEKGYQYESFEDFIGKMWKEEQCAKQVDVGYRVGVWEQYGIGVDMLRAAEASLVAWS